MKESHTGKAPGRRRKRADLLRTLLLLLMTWAFTSTALAADRDSGQGRQESLQAASDTASARQDRQAEPGGLPESPGLLAVLKRAYCRETADSELCPSALLQRLPWVQKRSLNRGAKATKTLDTASRSH